MAVTFLLCSCESSEVSTDPVVSTEGLGSSPSTMSVATDRSQGSEERVYRPGFTRMARGEALSS